MPDFTKLPDLPGPADGPLEGNPFVWTRRFYDWLKAIDRLARGLVSGSNSIASDLTAASTALRVEMWSWTIPYPEDEDEPVIENIPYGGVINTSSSKSGAGTATLAIKINGSSIGNANSVSTSRNVQTHDVAFVAGDNVALNFSSTSNCERANITVKVTRTI